MIGVLGAGAFGTALAVTLAADGREVMLWARDAGDMVDTRENRRRLPGVTFPDALRVTDRLGDLAQAKTVLLAVPMQSLAHVLADAPMLDGKTLVACCKGVDLTRLTGPSRVISDICPAARVAVLTGPSFATDIARGLPTALTLAASGPDAETLQQRLSTPTVRLYLTDDLIGAELGGALKNVIAIACGAVIGAGLGESARAAVMTRGFAEMTRAAVALGARAETLTGLSGLGDLALTCASPQSRNFAAGLSLGRGDPLDPTKTVEGAATARAMTRLARDRGLELPLTSLVAALVAGHTTVEDAMAALMARPLKSESET